jgi:hypothetical protein
VTEGALAIWTVYDHPSDYPDDYIAFRDEITSAGSRRTGEVIRSTDLKHLRTALADYGLTRLPRDLLDDPVIVETWL